MRAAEKTANVSAHMIALTVESRPAGEPVTTFLVDATFLPALPTVSFPLQSLKLPEPCHAPGLPLDKHLPPMLTEQLGHE